MSMSAVALPINELVAFCHDWHIAELAVFGSVLRDDFRPDSDIDLLATFADDADWSLLDSVRMNQEIEALLQRPVDLVSRRALERSANSLRRNAILASAQVIYPREEARHVA